MDDASSVFDASILTGPIANYPVADSFNRARERDYSTGDIPHVFVSSVVWDLPAGAGRARQWHGVLGALANDWTVAVARHAPVGRAGRGDADDELQCVRRLWRAAAESGRRSDVAGRRADASQWFNTAAFAAAPVFTLGSASRNPVRGPSYRDVDLALTRRIPCGRSRAIEVRAEVFNLLNTANLGAPNAVAGGRELRDDHDGVRSARRAARAEVRVLTDARLVGDVGRSQVVAARGELGFDVRTQRCLIFKNIMKA